MTGGDMTMDVEILDANIIDAASSGTTVGWQLAINVAAMLVSFVALVAMANLGFSWFGDFFRTGHGLLLFDLMAVAAVSSLVFVEKKGGTSDAFMWTLLGAIFAVVLALKLLDTGEWARDVTDGLGVDMVLDHVGPALCDQRAQRSLEGIGIEFGGRGLPGDDFIDARET